MRTDIEKYGLSGRAKNVLIDTARFEKSDGQTGEKAVAQPPPSPSTGTVT